MASRRDKGRLRNKVGLETVESWCDGGAVRSRKRTCWRGSGDLGALEAGGVTLGTRGGAMGQVRGPAWPFILSPDPLCLSWTSSEPGNSGGLDGGEAWQFPINRSS